MSNQNMFSFHDDELGDISIPIPLDVLNGLQRGELLVASTFHNTSRGIIQQNQPYILQEQEPLQEKEIDILLSNEVSASNSDLCTICFDDISIDKGVVVIKTVCNHMFCKPCLKSWLEKHNNCPICRVDFKLYF